MDKKKRIALVAHDNRKKDLVEWVEWNWEKLIKHHLTCTGTTGRLVEEALGKILSLKNLTNAVEVSKLKSGPLGGDQQLGALIAEGKIDLLIFLWDPMQAQPHDVDVKALLRISTLYNIPTAINRATADFMISSDIFDDTYQQQLKDYSGYIMRNVGQ
jgi:methylglyoxal synthase